MSYISSRDARQQDSGGEVEGFSTPKTELFACTCHPWKRWPLYLLTIENNGQRHCPNQRRPQGGRTDRDVIRQQEVVELQRLARDDAESVKWPISPLENVAVVLSLSPAPLQLPIVGVGSVVFHGLNLTSADTVRVAVPGDPIPTADDSTEGEALRITGRVWSGDGTSCTVAFAANPDVGFLFPAQVGDFNLFYNGAEYSRAVLIR